MGGLVALTTPHSDAVETIDLVTRGEQLRRADLGPQGPLTQRAGSTTTAPTTLRSVQINGGVRVKHDFTFTDCRIIGSPSATKAGYTVEKPLSC